MKIIQWIPTDRQGMEQLVLCDDGNVYFRERARIFKDGCEVGINEKFDSWVLYAEPPVTKKDQVYFSHSRTS